MRSSFLGFIALQAASAVLGNPVPASEYEQLAALAQSAFEKTKSEIDGGEIQRRGGTCSWYNVKIRREWYVSLSPV